MLPGQVAAMYLRGDPDPPGGVVCAQDPSAAYWQSAMLHDTLHAASFVARCAPHHNPAHRGHVSGPTNDLMYGRADENSPGWDITNLELDVGRDDYYEHREDRCLDLADSPYLTPRLPAGNFTPNPSFELDTRYWATRQGTLARVPAPGAPHGDFAVKVSASSGSSAAFVSDCPAGIGCSVQSTTAGTSYVASAHVRASGVTSLGSPARIVLREYTSSGSLVKQWVSQPAWLTSSFSRLTVTGHAVASGHVIGVRVEQPSAYPGGEFLADLITIEERP